MSYLTYSCLRSLRNGVAGLHGKRTFASANKLVEVSLNEDTGVSTVTMNRPPTNNLSLKLFQQLGDTIDELEKSKSNGMILTSALPKVFCAGIELSEIFKPDPARFRIYWATFRETWLKLYGSSFPTVCAMNGTAPGGGCILAISCDYRIMVDSPKNVIGLNEAAFGVVVPTFLQKSMSNLIGHRQTELALTTARLFSVEEALRVGLIDETATDKDDAIKKADKYLKKFSSIQPIVTKVCKGRVRQDTLDSMIEEREKDMDFYVEWFQKPEVYEHLKSIFDRLQAAKKK